MNWWIGCSGFHYKHWKTIFYPDGLPQKKWFEFYCKHYNTLELNVTFYRFPRLNFMENWHQISPSEFKFAVKAPRAITHFKKFTGVESMLGDFYGVVEQGLKRKAGTVLFQLPPRYGYKDERLDKILDCLDPSFDNVLEFRESSWWTADVFKKLANRKVIFCGMSYPGLPTDVMKNYKFVYYRFHGIEQLYQSKYDETFLHQFADELTAVKKIKTAYIYFNNDISGSAIENASMLKQYVEQLKASATSSTVF